jgi:hypothetical protein
MQKYCRCCGFDLEECYGCGFTRDPELDDVCPNCGADLPNESLGICLTFQPVAVREPSQLEILEVFPSL